MEDGASKHDVAGHVARTPPPPPEPSANTSPQSFDTSSNKSDQPLQLASETWDITTVSGLGALHMLIQALQNLADAMGDVPPTPPVSRPPSPRKNDDNETGIRRTSSPEVPCHDMIIGSPEAHPHEPIIVGVGEHAEDVTLQRIAIARRFFSKVAPPFSVSDYLLRIHHFCPHSPGVYLTAAVYCHRLCVADLMVPATNRTVHRLSLAAVRVASKALEDNKWTQDRIAKVGGVSRTQLMNLEVTMCFLLDFELGVDAVVLAKGTFLLQQAGKQGLGAKKGVSESFKLKLPLRKRTNSAWT